jgi:site-specific DNA recombinase
VKERGYRTIAELTEDERGASGASLDLPQLNRALEMARNGEYDVLVVREIDRLARNLAKQLIVEEELRRAGVQIEYVLGDYANTPEGQLNKQIRAVIAEYEREKIKERMVRGRRRKVREGNVIVHANPPYGYRLVEKNGRAILEIVEDLAQVIRMIFDWYVSGGLGTAKIAKKLNELGVAAPSVAKNTATPQAARGWSHSAVNRVLHNETYAGTWHYGKRHTLAGQKHPNNYLIAVTIPAIIGRDTYDKAHQQCKQNLRDAKRRTKREYLVARRCYCGECNSSMVVADHRYKGRPYAYYRCSVPHTQITHHVSRTCNMRTHFRTDNWDTIVWAEIRNLLASFEAFELGVQKYQREQELSKKPTKNRLELVTRLIAQKEKEHGKLLDEYVRGDFPRKWLVDGKQRIEAELAALQVERASLSQELAHGLTSEDIAELLKIAKETAEGLTEADEDFSTRRRLIEQLNTRVVFAVEDGERIAWLHCDFGKPKRLTKSSNAPAGGSPSPRPEWEPSANSPAGEGDNYMCIEKHNTDCKRN